VQIETSDTNDAAALVRSGLGAGFLPKYLADGDARVRWIEIEDAALELCVSVGTARGRTLSAAAARLAAPWPGGEAGGSGARAPGPCPGPLSGRMSP
jgi:DNA-binding transcriptional LysR family regulator